MNRCLETLHFSIQTEFTKFRTEICEEYPHINPKLFQKETKLHITIGVLYLLSEKEVQQARKLLLKCKSIINNIISDYEVSAVKLDMKGVEIMNDDPYMTDIVYAKVDDSDELLQGKIYIKFIIYSKFRDFGCNNRSFLQSRLG